MKKRIITVLAVLLPLALSVTIVLAFFPQLRSWATESDLREWFDREAMPVVVAVGAAVVSLCAMLWPVLAALNNGAKLFKKSRGTFDTVTEHVLNTEEAITGFKDGTLAEMAELKRATVSDAAALRERLAADVSAIAAHTAAELSSIRAEISEVLLRQGGELAASRESIDNIIKALLIAFGNDRELVRNGYAGEIMRVLKSDEEAENEEQK